MLLKLYKLAHTLDEKKYFDEAKAIEEVMETMAQRVGIDLKEIVSLANYFDEKGEVILADYLDNIIKETVHKIIAKPKKKKLPPKKWWKKMEKEIKKHSPDYDDERVSSTIGDIWFHNLTEKKRNQIIKRDSDSGKGKNKDK